MFLDAPHLMALISAIQAYHKSPSHCMRFYFFPPTLYPTHLLFLHLDEMKQKGDLID